MKSRRVQTKKTAGAPGKRVAQPNYAAWSGGIATLLEGARRQAARSVNAILTASYWEIGRRIVDFVQAGQKRAEYGEEVLKQLSHDLLRQFGRGFAPDNLERMRAFYLAWPIEEISATLSRKSGGSRIVQMFEQLETGVAPAISATLSRKSAGKKSFQAKPHKFTQPIYATLSRKSDVDQALYLEAVSQAFPLSWSQYVRLLSVENPEARRFYETEALHGGWSVRQLDRQISTLFYERTALSRHKAKMLQNGARARHEDRVTVEEEIKSPLMLEFLGLRDEYAESDLEDALIKHLEHFLLELGNNFTFVARQKRIRIGDNWYRIDLLLFHRRLRCLVIIDLKVGRFSHADAGAMNLYVNYVRKHLTLPEENPPIGLILCSEPDSAVARYALDGLTNQILAPQYRLKLPQPAELEMELQKTRRMLETTRRLC